MAKKMHLEDLLYTQGFGTRRVCAGLLEKGLVQVYVDDNTSQEDKESSVAGVFTASKATECIAEGLRFKVQGEDWEYVEDPQPAVDGGDGSASVQLSAEDEELLLDMKMRTMSDPDTDPVTGADLGAGMQQQADA